MSEKSSTTMGPWNVENFDIWIFEARELVVSVVPLQAPWRTAVENYRLDEPTE